MASDDKIKRFRQHVVQELYETEKDYTNALDFTVTHLMVKIRQQAANDPALKAEVIDKLFCNIEDLLGMHQRLTQDLHKFLGSGASYDTQISQCYIRYQQEFTAYKTYGENNEHAQKILYELEEQLSFKAFCIGVMMLGGKSEVSLSPYLFKPIQRICKYPLLFRELLKYTPETHDDYENTCAALEMMRELCSVINEAKRRVEHLEAIADWQSTVDGWEGSPVVDTCSEKIKEGALIKISAGNMQERMFFLFDNLLVYCKKITGFPLRSKTEYSYQFKGRIPVANLEIENIDDGTADYHTSGITVTHGWKVRNLAKNKWFVLIAKSPSEKQQWIDAIKSQKDRIKRVAAGILRDTRTVMVDKGGKLHKRLLQENRILQDHRYRLKVYPKSFLGSDFAQWLVEIKEAGDVNEAVRLGQGLLENGVIHHVGDRHQFKNSSLVYRFRVDDGTFRTNVESYDSLAKGLRVYAYLHSLYKPPVKDQRAGLRQHKTAITGQKLVDWILDEKVVETREEGVAFGAHLMVTGLLKHATDDQKFKDSNSLYYQFVPDVTTDHAPQHTDFAPIATFTCLSITVPYDSNSDNYGFEVSEVAPLKVTSVDTEGPAQLTGLAVGQEVVGVAGQWLLAENSPFVTYLSIMESQKEQRASLEVLISKDHVEQMKLELGSRPLGLQLKGNHPVVVNEVTRDSESASAGVIPRCYIKSVEDEIVVSQSHDKVVAAIKQAKEAGKDHVTLRIGFPDLQLLTRYRYDSTNDCVMEIIERVQESPYLYDIPAQLFKLYENELKLRIDLLSRCKKVNSQVQDYITELQVQSNNYKKAHSTFLVPRYPSYRPYGAPPSSSLEACAINLHTVAMEVGPTSASTRAATPSSPTLRDPEGSMASLVDCLDSVGPHYEHFFNTMAVPSLSSGSNNPKSAQILKECTAIGNLLAHLDIVYAEIVRDCELLQRLTVHPSEEGPFSPIPTRVKSESFQNGIVASSPSLSMRAPFQRERNLSFLNPNPLMKLILDGLVSKLNNFKALIDDEMLGNILNTAARCVKDQTKEGLIKKWNEKIDTFKSELAVLSDSRDSIRVYGASLSTHIKPLKKDVQLYLEIGLSLCDNLDVTYSWDRLFSQCLTAIVTGFANMLTSAVKGHFNHQPEFINNSSDAISQWVELIVNKGLIVCVDTLLATTMANERASLQDLVPLMERLKTVTFHLQELESQQPAAHISSSLPPITLTGNHSQLHITFSLPPHQLEKLPESLCSGEDISIIPIVFNTCLQGVSGEYSKIEQEINEASFITLRDYYRALRQFNLNKASLPEDEIERAVILGEISRPLNVLESIMRQIEGTIRDPTAPGTGLLPLMTEICQRLGGVHVYMCDSGVHRCLSAVTVEQVLLLGRCHQLHPRALRSALSTLRTAGALPYLEKKNTAHRSKSFPVKPPSLFQLPPRS